MTYNNVSWLFGWLSLATIPFAPLLQLGAAAR
jgi:hypothetical protein